MIVRVVNFKDPTKDNFKRIDCSRSSSFRLGNPIKIENDITRSIAIEKFSYLIEENYEFYYKNLKNIIDDCIKENKNLELACYCKPAACHCDLYIPIINIILFEDKIK